MADRERVRGLVTEATLLLGSLLVCGIFMFRTGFQGIADVPSYAGHVEEKTKIRTLPILQGFPNT